VLFGHTLLTPLILGATGNGLVPMVILLDAGDVPHDVEHVAV
jgi:hypothetical protein